MDASSKSLGERPVAFPGAGTRIAMIAVHTSPLARPGGYAAGGLNVYVRETARRLGRGGYEVDIFTRDDGSQPALVTLGQGVRVVSLPAGPRRPLPKEQIVPYLPEFLHAVRHFRQRHDLHYDLLNSHYWQAGWVATLLAPRWGIPHVAIFHTLGEVKNLAHLGEGETDYRIDTERRIARCADRVVCFGDHEKQVLTGTYGVADEQATIIPCGVDLRRFRPMNREAVRKTLGFDSRPIVLYVGRLDSLKGIDILVEAMAQLERRDARLLIIGGDEQAAPEIARLRRRAATVGLGDRVSFVGAVEQAELPKYYNAADVCVMPSYYESFGLVAVEAMACGTPVIASRVGGLAKTVGDGETGYLIPWRCPEPFAERIDLILGNAELRRNLGRAARQSMLQYSWERVTQELAAEFARVWQERASGVACHGDSQQVGGGLSSSHGACDAR